jgi:hypothetical protein
MVVGARIKNVRDISVMIVVTLPHLLAHLWGK